MLRQFLYVFFVFIIIVIFRLFYLQINQKEKFAFLGKRNFLRTEILPPPRGNLHDCNGVLLASNRPVFDLYWHGSGSHRLTEGQLETIKRVGLLIGKDLDPGKVVLAERYSRRVLLKRDLNFDELCKISEQCHNFINLFIANRFERVYPYANLASHLLGYLGNNKDVISVGRAGLERFFQDKLKGECGYSRHVINSTGSRLKELELHRAKAGLDVGLTLDIGLQKAAERLFQKDQSGAFILMDPKDGSIRVMASYPSFDPNLFLDSISHYDWNNKFTKGSPLLNRVTHAVYPPASVFKLITYAAGLEEGIISSTSTFKCKGFTLFCGRKYMCQRHWGHGKLNLSRAIAYSCNIPCYDIALQLKIDQIAEYAFRFGLGRRTGLLLSEKRGLVPTYGWKVANKGERWWKGETLSASLGQTYLLVTPLQVARMISAISTGYLVKPRILIDEDIEIEDLYISDETLSILRFGMGEAVNRGTARSLRGLKSFKIHAKTGTAQITSLEKQQKKKKSQLEHAWFASYFKYKDHDPMTMIVVIENAGTSRPAQKIAFEFLKSYEKIVS